MISKTNQSRNERLDGISAAKHSAAALFIALHVFQIIIVIAYSFWEKIKFKKNQNFSISW